VVSRILADPGTPARLAWPHTLRVLGGVFLIVLALDKLPAVFAIPAGLGDIAVGVAAPFVAWRLASGTDRGGAVRSAVWFNILGIVDLAVAVSIGFLAGLGPTRLLQVTPSTEALTLLPLALIPTTAVPLAVALHLVSLRRLTLQLRDHRTVNGSERPSKPRRTVGNPAAIRVSAPADGVSGARTTAGTPSSPARRRARSSGT
jgi:hypothetical protein